MANFLAYAPMFANAPLQEKQAIQAQNALAQIQTMEAIKGVGRQNEMEGILRGAKTNEERASALESAGFIDQANALRANEQRSQLAESRLDTEELNRQLNEISKHSAELQLATNTAASATPDNWPVIRQEMIKLGIPEGQFSEDWNTAFPALQQFIGQSRQLSALELRARAYDSDPNAPKDQASRNKAVYGINPAPTTPQRQPTQIEIRQRATQEAIDSGYMTPEEGARAAAFPQALNAYTKRMDRQDALAGKYPLLKKSPQTARQIAGALLEGQDDDGMITVQGKDGKPESISEAQYVDLAIHEAAIPIEILRQRAAAGQSIPAGTLAIDKGRIFIATDIGKTKSKTPMQQMAEKPVDAKNLRVDGTKKGEGWLGVLQRPDGGVSSELSIGVKIDGKETEIPTMVPGLTEQELFWLLTNEPGKVDIPKSIVDKAVAHAKKRISLGKSPFKD